MLILASLVALLASALTWLATSPNKFISNNLEPLVDLWNFVSTPINVIAYGIVWNFYSGELPVVVMLILIFVEWFILALIVIAFWVKLFGRKTMAK